MGTDRERDDDRRALKRMAREYEADYSGDRPRLKRRRGAGDVYKKRRGCAYGTIIVLITVGVGAWYGWPSFKEYAPDTVQRLRSTYDYVVESAKKLWEEIREIDGLLPETSDDEYMYCQTARLCAVVIKNDYQAKLDVGEADFDAVFASGKTVTFEYRLDTVRSDFPDGIVEDGRTLDEWADEEIVADIRIVACGELDHWDFIKMGGTVIHDYRFADGEPFRQVVIDYCP